MEVKGRFDHFNFNVLDLDKSIRFYERSVGIKGGTPDGGFGWFFYFGVYGGREDGFSIELTWLRDRKEPYDLGKGSFISVCVFLGDYDAVRAYHKQMDCVCYENTDMGLYFINDPDGYWIEILPEQK